MPVLLAACRTAPSVETEVAVLSADEKALRALDSSFDGYLEATALPVQVGAVGAFKAALQEKTARMKDLEQKYGAFAESVDPVAYAHAGLRVGQLYLNMGCEIATMKGPEQYAEAFEKALAEQAKPLLDKSKTALQRSSKTGGGKYSDAAAEILNAWSEDPGTMCAAFEEHWAAKGRPATAGETVADGCSDPDQLANVPQPQCAAQYRMRCAKEDGAGCNLLGTLAYQDGEVEQAAELFEKGCQYEDGASCRALASLSVPTRRDEYREACLADDAVGCMQFARLIEADSDRPAIRSCSAKKALPDAKDAAAKCATGEAAACWARAAQLVSKRKVELDGEPVGVLMGMGMIGALGAQDTEDAEARKERLEGECADGSGGSCLILGYALHESGADPTSAFRRGCELGNDGACIQLADTLMKTGKSKAVAEAVDLYVANCADGSGWTCLTVGKMFREGNLVPRSDACAAAFAWQTCQPETPFSCTDVNRVFHPLRSPPAP